MELLALAVIVAIALLALVRRICKPAASEAESLIFPAPQAFIDEDDRHPESALTVSNVDGRSSVFADWTDPKPGEW